MFFGRTDAEAETPILWPLDAKNGLIGKDPDALSAAITLNSSTLVKFFLPVKYYRLTRGPPGLSGPHLGETLAQMMHD